jgi:hypothetical protein
VHWRSPFSVAVRHSTLAYWPTLHVAHAASSTINIHVSGLDSMRGLECCACNQVQDSSLFFPFSFGWFTIRKYDPSWLTPEHSLGANSDKRRRAMGAAGKYPGRHWKPPVKLPNDGCTGKTDHRSFSMGRYTKNESCQEQLGLIETARWLPWMHCKISPDLLTS